MAIRSQHIVLFCFAMICLSAYAQQAERVVIATAGDEFITAKASMEWTLGEVMVESYNIGQVILNQGFHQPEALPTGINQQEVQKLGLRIYPNPTAQWLYFERNESQEHLVIKLMDGSGKLILESTWPAYENNYQLDLRSLAAGIYLLHLFDETQSKTYPYRIAKIAYE